jgi:hypothetical protein
MKSHFAYCFFILLNVNFSFAQFEPPAGQPGTSAMYKDSSAFIDWVTSCTVVRGPMDISTTAGGYASAGDSSQVFGIAGSNGVVSLGDGGSAICNFSIQVSNGPGYDFAVFENGFDDFFLELAFVEVSSDGINFFRFPATSLTQDTVQVSTFDSLDATQLNNLAGKYRALYGTPFDLQELNAVAGLDINAVTHIKIIDVVGCISNYSTYDQYGTKINEPWPTAFATGGFDLEAIGIIHNWLNTVPENTEPLFGFYPNPSSHYLHFVGENNAQSNISISSLDGKLIYTNPFTRTVDISGFEKGVYLVTLQTAKGKVTKKLFLE